MIITGDRRRRKFDHVFGADSTQEQVYRSTTLPLVNRCLEGYNATVLAYGQTGSGKTFTVGNAYTVRTRARCCCCRIAAGWIIRANDAAPHRRLDAYACISLPRRMEDNRNSTACSTPSVVENPSLVKISTAVNKQTNVFEWKPARRRAILKPVFSYFQVQETTTLTRGGGQRKKGSEFSQGLRPSLAP